MHVYCPALVETLVDTELGSEPRRSSPHRQLAYIAATQIPTPHACVYGSLTSLNRPWWAPWHAHASSSICPWNSYTPYAPISTRAPSSAANRSLSCSTTSSVLSSAAPTPVSLCATPIPRTAALVRQDQVPPEMPSDGRAPAGAVRRDRHDAQGLARPGSRLRARPPRVSPAE